MFENHIEIASQKQRENQKNNATKKEEEEMIMSGNNIGKPQRFRAIERKLLKKKKFCYNDLLKIWEEKKPELNIFHAICILERLQNLKRIKKVCRCYCYDEKHYWIYRWSFWYWLKRKIKIMKEWGRCKK